MRLEFFRARVFAELADVHHGSSPETSGRFVLAVVGFPVAAVLVAWIVLTLRARAGARRKERHRDADQERVQPPVELLLGVAALSAGAGLVHAAVTAEHFEEHVAYGFFFVAIAIAQGVWPVWMVRSRSRLALTAGLIGNAVIIAIWIMSRTSGVPVGPEAFEPETVGATDGLAAVYEVGIVGGCALLLRRWPRVGPVRLLTGSLRTPVFASVVALVTFAVLLAGNQP